MSDLCFSFIFLCMYTTNVLMLEYVLYMLWISVFFVDIMLTWYIFLQEFLFDHIPTNIQQTQSYAVFQQRSNCWFQVLSAKYNQAAVSFVLAI